MTPNDPTPDKASGSRQQNYPTRHECGDCGAAYSDPDAADACCDSEFVTAAELRDGETREDSHTRRTAEMLADLRGEADE
jgi:hypothetical protein